MLALELLIFGIMLLVGLGLILDPNSDELIPFTIAVVLFIVTVLVK